MNHERFDPREMAAVGVPLYSHLKRPSNNQSILPSLPNSCVLKNKINEMPFMPWKPF